ncbi:MAG: hypothetical protein H6628_05295 [Calditrichae bacterium]|nr:hypothetical protein [Calditrichia bacterium]
MMFAAKKSSRHACCCMLPVGTGKIPTALAQHPHTAPTDIEFKSYIEESRVPANRQVVFHLELSWTGDMKRYQFTRIPQPVLTNLLLEMSSSSNKLETLPSGQTRSIKRISYQLSPLEMGMAYIDAVEVAYRDILTGEDSRLFSQRMEIKIIEPVAEGRSKLEALIYVVLLILFSGTIAYFLILYVRKRKDNRSLEHTETSPAERYHDRLAREIDPKGANLSEMTGRMSKLFREYLAEDFQIRTTESNVDAILERLQSAGVEAADIRKLTELFRKLDVIKFAGSSVDPAEFSLLCRTIEDF